MIEVISRLSLLRARITAWRRDDMRIAFVPTMGNLHAGHQSLVRLARAQADRVVASVFVNPTQFGPGEDFERYPRTPDADAAALQDAGCDLLWLPDAATMYPFGPAGAVQVRVPGITDVLDGAHRPGHFDGVATVVARLFNQVQPDLAAFGRKDYQQLAVIGHLVRDLAFPIQLLAAPTLRADDGLALSSRNQYLDTAQRAVAPRLHAALLQMQASAAAGGTVQAVEAQATQALLAAGFVVDYAVLRDRSLGALTPGQRGPQVALVAARLGRTRLIDNLEFTLD